MIVLLEVDFVDLSDRIFTVRSNLSLSQEKFGELIGKSQRTIAAWEAGDRSPSFSTLCKLADVFDVSVDYLLGRTDSFQSENKKPIVSDDELRKWAINRVSVLSDQELVRVHDFLTGLEAGSDISKAQATAHDPDGESSE